MQKPILRKMLAMLFAMLLVPAAAFADMSVTYDTSTPQNPILIKAGDQLIAISMGQSFSNAPLLSVLAQMQAKAIDLWIIAGISDQAFASVGNVLSTVTVHNVWLDQTLQNSPALTSLFDTQGTKRSDASAQNTLSIGDAQITFENSSSTGTALRIGYGNTGFAFFSTPSLIKGSALLNNSDLIYITGSDPNEPFAIESARPALVVLDSASFSKDYAGAMAQTLASKGFTVLMDTGAAFSMVSNGQEISLSGISAYGLINKAKVNVRSAPSVDAGRAAGLTKNDAVQITGLAAAKTAGEYWFQIAINGRTSYVRSDLVTQANPNDQQALKSQVGKAAVKKTPKPTVDTTSGATKKKH